MLFLAFFMQITFAQEKNITGKVTDDTGPLPGVTVLIKGTTNGTETDFDGNYSIKANTGDVLVFSFVGMTTKEVTVANSNTINVTLKSSNVLDEVVIVGFGQQTKKSLTSSVAKVDTEDIKSIATPTISGALQGSANGLQVNQNSGVPGGSFSVRVRGASSINGSNEPLYVVDGVPIVTGSLGTAFTGGQSNDVLSNLNFSDIESIQILKDASSSAIYGARGANGVVLITTKRGKVGKPQISINSYAGFQDPIKKPETFTAGEYYKFADTALESAFGAPGLMSNGAILRYSPLNDPDLGFSSLEELYAADFGDNYTNAIYKDSPAIVRQTDVTISGGNEKARYYANFTDFKQEGTIIGQEFDRRSLSFNANFNATDKLEIEASTTISQSDNSRIGGDNNIYGALTTSILEIPGYKLFNENGTYNTASFLFSNPLQNAQVDQQDSRTLRLFSTLGLNYKFNRKLSLRSKASLERIDFKDLTFYPSTTRRGAPSGGEAAKDINLINRWNVTNTLNYNTTFADDKWDLSGLIGFSFEGTNNDVSYLKATQIPAGFSFPAAGVTPTDASNLIRENKLFSYFMRVGVSYLDKLFIEGTVRSDASSRFGDNFKIGYFPAASVGYLISNEDWFKNNAVTSLKARVSWGQTGNQTGIGNFGSRFLASPNGYATVAGIRISQLPAPDLSWETTTQTNAGIDVTFFDKLDVTYDYYIKDTKDVLQSRPLRNSSGFTSVSANIGDIRNKGHEFSLNWRVLEKENFSWTTQFQAAYLHNEVLEIQRDAAGDYIPIDLGFATRVQAGQQLGAFFGLKADGLWQEGDNIPASLVDRGVSAGDVKYVDLNNDGNIDAKDRTFLGNPLPTWTGNFRNTVRFKNFDFSANLQFEQDKQIFNNTLAFAGSSGSFVFNKFKSQLNYWTPENTDTDLPRPRFGPLQSYNNQDSDRFIEDGSYVRLKEIVLGYTFNDNFFKKKNMSLRIYGGVDNLVTWTDYSGLDPEVNSFGNSNVTRGTDFFAQGLNKTYKFGINFKF